MKRPLDADDFYDRLAADYHLVYENWDGSIERQSAVLGTLLGASLSGGSARVLDCACGIGTQAIGMARMGCRVTATDISRRAVRRAGIELRKRNLRPERLLVADMRKLPAEFDGCFDAVVCCDNPLAHLLVEEDLLAAFRCMHAALRAGGQVLTSSRDYDAILVSRPSQTPVRTGSDNRGVTAAFQLWHWDKDDPIYTSEHFVLRRGLSGWKVRHLVTRMRAWGRADIASAAREAGFREVEWKTPEQSGYFQPVMTAFRANSGG